MTLLILYSWSLLLLLSSYFPAAQVDILRDVQESRENKRPYVITFCGVNGVGKSTNLAKICFWLIENKFRVLIAACDTFRCAPDSTSAPSSPTSLAQGWSSRTAENPHQKTELPPPCCRGRPQAHGQQTDASTSLLTPYTLVSASTPPDALVTTSIPPDTLAGMNI